MPGIGLDWEGISDGLRLCAPIAPARVTVHTLRVSALRCDFLCEFFRFSSASSASTLLLLARGQPG